MNAASLNQNQQKAVNLDITRPRPVLMIPLRRCGSHALRLRLNNNPAFYSPYPLHIVDFMPLLPAYGDLNNDQNYFRLIVDLVGLQNASMVKWPGMVFDPVDILESIKSEKRSIHRILWELLLRAGQQHQAKIVMDKSLDSVHYADDLLALFPDMLFLNVVRDPRAQVSSMNRAIIHDYDSGLNAMAWLQAHKKARELIERIPGQVLTIRYEDFLSNQEVILRKICQFFEIDFTDAMLDVAHSDEAQQIAHRSALWENNCFPPLLANKDKFKQQLSIDEINIIETICGELMQLYGYELMSPANFKLNTDFITSAKLKSDANRTLAWQNLQTQNYKDFVLRRFRADYLTAIKQKLEAQH